MLGNVSSQPLTYTRVGYGREEEPQGFCSVGLYLPL